MAKKAPPPAIDFRAYFPEKSPRGVKLYVPYTADFEDLPPASKYDAACELKLLEEEGGEPRPSVLSFLQGEIDYWLTAAALEDPVFDLGHNFWIEPGKGGGLVQLHPHQQQLAIVEAFVAAWVAGAPLKLLLLKARQMGISTICMALALRLITRFPNMHAGFVAHTQDDMKTIFTKYKVAFDNDTFALKPGVEQQNTTELVLDNGGWVKGRTAGGKAGQMFRGSVLQIVHTSESAQFKDGDSDTFNAITPSLPKEDNSFYAWFDESTAFGRRGGFYERFLAAKYKPESTDWRLMFLPWNQRWNTLPPYVTCTAEERRDILATLNEREYGWMEKWGVQPEQIKWARRAWKELVANDEEERAQIWMQEYPINDVEAFVAKGGTIFNHVKLDEQLAVIKKNDAENPPWVGSIRHAADTPPDYFSGLESAKYRTPKPSLEKGSGGPLTRWVHPMVGHRYLIGVDVAEGKKKGDYSAAVVYDLTKRRFVARWMARMFPEDFIEPLRLLSRHYNDAQLNIEVATFGAQLCRELEKTDRQPFLCLARDASQTRVGDPYELRWGWKTTDTSKRQLVQYMRKIIATQIDSLTDPMMVEQLMLYEESQSDSGRINIEGAPKGKYDDVAMAGMICLMGVEDSGYRPPVKMPDAPKPNPWDDGDIPAPVEPTMKERVLATNRRLQARIDAEESGMGDRFLEYE